MREARDDPQEFDSRTVKAAMRSLSWLALLLAITGHACARSLPRGTLDLREVTGVPEHRPPTAVVGATLQLRVTDDARLDTVLRVGAGGTIDFPLCGRVEVGGLAGVEIESRMRECLSAYLRDPNVSVMVLDTAQSVNVLGDLAGQFRWEGALTLVGALLQIGGEGIAEKLDHVRVIRNGRVAYLDPLRIASGQARDVYLEPGDTVFVHCKSESVCAGGRGPAAQTKSTSGDSPSVRKALATISIRSSQSRAAVPSTTGLKEPELRQLTDRLEAFSSELPQLVHDVLPTAGVAATAVRITPTDLGISIEVTGGTAGEAAAKCTSILVATRAGLAERPNPAQQWIESQLARIRGELRQLGDSLRTTPIEGPCEDEDSIQGLTACAHARRSNLSATTPQAYARDCATGALCSIARRWFDADRRVAELATQYGSAHPAMRAAVLQRAALITWFGQQKSVELAALDLLDTRIRSLGARTRDSVDVIRLDAVLERLESRDFDVALGVAADMPASVRAAAFECGVATVDRAGLLSRFTERHPEVILADARLQRIREGLQRVVPIEVERLKVARRIHQTGARPRGEDRRLREAERRRGELLHMLELLDRLREDWTPELIVVRPCASS